MGLNIWLDELKKRGFIIHSMNNKMDIDERIEKLQVLADIKTRVHKIWRELQFDENIGHYAMALWDAVNDEEKYIKSCIDEAIMGLEQSK